MNPRAGYPTYTLSRAPLRPLEYFSRLRTHNFLCQFEGIYILKCIVNYTEGISYCQPVFYKKFKLFCIILFRDPIPHFTFLFFFHDYHTYLSTFLLSCDKIYPCRNLIYCVHHPRFPVIFCFCYIIYSEVSHEKLLCN